MMHCPDATLGDSWRDNCITMLLVYVCGIAAYRTLCDRMHNGDIFKCNVRKFKVTSGLSGMCVD